MSEFRRPSPEESGEVTEARLTRRGFLKGALGLGLAAATGTLFRPESATASLSPLRKSVSGLAVPDQASPDSVSGLAVPDQASPDDIDDYIFDLLDASGDEEAALDDQLVILENFQEYTPESMVEAVTNNINTFKKTRAKKILEVGGLGDAPTKINSYGEVPSPVVDLSPGEDGGGPDYFISSREDPSLGFNNLAVTTGNTVHEGDRKATILHLQGINLGRTKHPFMSASGEFTAHVGYFGMYIGDPEVKLMRIVMPVFLGAERNDGQMSSFLYTSVANEVDTPISAPFSTSGLQPSLSGGLAALDENIGTSVTLLQIDSEEIPPLDLPDQAEALGLPREPYEIKYVEQEIETTLTTRDALQNITIKLVDDANQDAVKQAEEEGNEPEAKYILNAIIGDEAPLPTPVATAYPEIGEIIIKDEIKRLANYKKYLNSDPLTADDTVALPRVMSMHITPTSSRIA